MVGQDTALSNDTFVDKGVEIQSIHSTSRSSSRQDDIEEGDVEKGLRQERKADVEDDSRQVRCGEEDMVKEGKGKGLKAIISRVSTRGSWKDPGPPPDGGWNAWTQSMF